MYVILDCCIIKDTFVPEMSESHVKTKHINNDNN